MASLGMILANVQMSHAHGDRRWRETAARYGWLTDYSKAKAEARKTGKPMMVVLRCVP